MFGRLTIERVRRTACIAAALVLLGTLGAAASIPSIGGSIHGCYLPATGILRVIDVEAGATCLPVETPISWNQTGPAGPPGATGATGATGPQGPMGVSGWERIQGSPVSPPMNAIFTATAACSSGKKVLGGGYTVAPVNPTIAPAVQSSYPNTSSSWTVSGFTNTSMTITAFAICGIA